MRFLAIGDTCDMASMYLRLAEQGHDLRIFVAEPSRSPPGAARSM